MEKTPVLKSKLSNLQNHRVKSDSRNGSSDNRHGSFTRNDAIGVFETDNEESPVQIACTQDGSETVDVVWDWNSPQAKKHPKKCQKRLHLPQSPKIPLKKFPSNNSIQNFEKIREELQALRQEIALPENEDSLRLSPREEADYKNIHISSVNPLHDDFNDDYFNDMFDEKLIEFSEKVEHKFTVSPNNNHTKVKKYTAENVYVENMQTLSFRKTTNISHMKIANDSFENILNDIDVEKLTCPFSEKDGYLKNVKTDPFETRPNILSNRLNHKNDCVNSGIKTHIRSNVYHTNSGKVEFHRTQSFELTNLEQSEDLPRCKLDEIEQKRQEARARLEMKRKHDQTISSSQSQCSSIEIENKRRQARAKLEAKRQQDIIEIKRQEALKRLQNRKKNAIIVKSSLTERLV